MKQADRERRESLAVSLQRDQLLSNASFVRSHKHSARGVEAFVDFEDVGEQRCGFDDVEIEQPRPILIRNQQDIGEAFRRDENRASTSSSQQRVRAARRAEPDAHVWNRLIASQAEGRADRQNRSLFTGGEFVASPRPDRVGKQRRDFEDSEPLMKRSDFAREDRLAPFVQKANVVAEPEVGGILSSQ